ncbi:MAG: hypothetical protein ACLTK0_11920 [Anaerovoracaceae bacterium]
MTEMFFASQNGRDIPKEDKIFGISNRAKAMIAEKGRENVVNATIGALLDDDGKLMVLSSVSDVFKSLDMAHASAMWNSDSTLKKFVQKYEKRF